MAGTASGKCLCGNITYTIEGDAKFSMICHCEQCQKITGTGHAAQFAIEESEVDLQGYISLYELNAESGSKVKSAFCGECGCPIYKTTDSMPGAIFFHAGSLEDTSQFKPEFVVYEDSKAHWDHVNLAIPRK